MHKLLLRNLAIVLGALALAGCATAKNPHAAAQKYLTGLPANSDPKMVGEKVAQDLLPRKIYCNTEGYIVYPEVCAAFGALRFADAAHDGGLEQKLEDRYAFIITPEGSRMISTNHHVDFHVFGILPMEIYQLNGDKRYRDL